MTAAASTLILIQHSPGMSANGGQGLESPRHPLGLDGQVRPATATAKDAFACQQALTSTMLCSRMCAGGLQWPGFGRGFTAARVPGGALRGRQPHASGARNCCHTVAAALQQARVRSCHCSRREVQADTRCRQGSPWQARSPAPLLCSTVLSAVRQLQSFRLQTDRRRVRSNGASVRVTVL